MAGSQPFHNCASCGMFLVYISQELPKVVKGKKTHEQTTTLQVANAYVEQRLACVVQFNWTTIVQLK